MPNNPKLYKNSIKYFYNHIIDFVLGDYKNLHQINQECNCILWSGFFFDRICDEKFNIGISKLRFESWDAVYAEISINFCKMFNSILYYLYYNKKFEYLIENIIEMS